MPAVLASAAVASAQPVEWSVVAKQGDAAPGTPAGVLFGNDLLPPAIDDLGRVGFRSNLTGAGVTSTNDYGIWYGPPSALALIAREGDSAPGLSGIRYLSFGAPVFGNGRIVFTARLTGTGVSTSNNLALYMSTDGGVPVLIARTGNAAAGLSTLRYSLFNDYAVNAEGRIVFRGVVTGAGVTSASDGAMWAGTPGNLSLVAREGAATGLGADLFFGDVSSGPLAMSAQGDVTFISTLIGNGAGTNPTGTLWRFTSGAPAAVIRTGMLAPGSGAGTTLFDLFNPPAAAGDGTIALGASLTGGNATSTNNKGIWAGRPDSMQLIARAGSRVPGTGLYYQAFTTSPYLSTSGRIAYGCTLLGAGVDTTNNTGVCLGSASYPVLMIRAGEEVAGAQGLVFAPAFVSKILLNTSGLAAFEWQVAGPGVTEDNDAVLQVIHTGGARMLVLREGESFQLADGDVRAVSRFFPLTSSTSQGGDGKGYSFNAAGEIALRVEFTDGTAALVVGQVLCPADLTRDGIVDFFDYLDFAEALAGEDPAADFNLDGVVDFFDYLDFVERFDAGC